MKKKTIVLVTGGVAALLIVGSASYLLGNKHAVETMAIRQATPHQLAEAMKADDFYSTYRENTLLVNGTVSAVRQTGNAMTVNLVSNSSYDTACVVNEPVKAIKVGDTIRIAAEGATAERTSHGVTLRNCQQL